MHKLARQVRFSINPFLAEDEPGFNPFASSPAGEGLSVFLELCVELVGEVEPSTGFVVNVAEIDRVVRTFAVPLFGGALRAHYRRAEHIGLGAMVGLLNCAWGELGGKFGAARLSGLGLRLNPFRRISIDSEDSQMFCFGEKFEFAATHKLWNEQFSERRNFELFGKCANPTGHGHNYVVEVTLRTPAGGGFHIGRFERVVEEELIRVMDHKNLNSDVAEFGRINPTVENIASFAYKKLEGRFSDAVLDCVTVWETDKTYCTFCGSEPHSAKK